VKPTCLVIAFIVTLLSTPQRASAGSSKILEDWVFDRLAAKLGETELGASLGIRSTESLAAESEYYDRMASLKAKETSEEIKSILPPQNSLEEIIRLDLFPNYAPIHLHTVEFIKSSIGEEAVLSGDEVPSNSESTRASIKRDDDRKVEPLFTFNVTNGKLEIGTLKTSKYIELKGGEINVYHLVIVGVAGLYCAKQECRKEMLHILFEDTMDSKDVEESLETARKANESPARESGPVLSPLLEVNAPHSFGGKVAWPP
jgi:hypothetical protein